ncbi:MAG: hypothetical protein IJZ09_05325 [Tidjanibacter sp.]|nr:hypothetical protein [Tidjanibacter sp.]
MTKEELCEALHREMLFYYFAQREPRLEVRTGEPLINAVGRKMLPYADCGFPRPITEADIEMLCNCSFAGLFHYDLEKGAEKITRLKQKLKSL